MKHARRVTGHASGWQEYHNTCICGKPWPCLELQEAANQWASRLRKRASEGGGTDGADAELDFGAAGELERLTCENRRLLETIACQLSKLERVTASHEDAVRTIRHQGAALTQAHSERDRLRAHLTEWERWTQGHAWIANSEYQALCELKRRVGPIPPNLIRSSDPANCTSIIYRSCEKHLGVPWTLPIAVTEARSQEICPICTPPHPVNVGG